jgi:hypothetical protein
MAFSFDFLAEFLLVTFDLGFLAGVFGDLVDSTFEGVFFFERLSS